MIQGIKNTPSISTSFPSEKKAICSGNEPLNSFENEDTAIISAQAKLLNELDKYNAGQSNETDLAITCINSKIQVNAAAKVINTKKK